MTALNRDVTAGVGSRKVRSIIISFDEENDVIRSDLDFAKRLADMRAAYPTWHIRGVVHDGDLTFIPQRPRPPPSASPGGADASLPPSSPVAMFVSEQQQQQHQAQRHSIAVDANSTGESPSDISEASSAGNVPDRPPARVRRGLSVRLTVPPYAGRIGVVSEVKHSDRFRVVFADNSGGWWCSRDDVEVVATGGVTAANALADISSATEVAVSPSTLEENRRLSARVAELESQLDALRSMLSRALGAVADATVASDGVGTREAVRRAKARVANSAEQEKVLSSLL